ncbi:MAG: hypothetical protein ACRDVL_11540 [Acidimicrobiia bacterium]
MLPELDQLALVACALLAWVAIVHTVLAFGLRRGEVAWGGRYPRLLPTPHRWGSAFYAFGLLVSAVILAEMAGLIDLVDMPGGVMKAAGWVVMVFLGVTALFSLFKGSRWERMLFGPIGIIGATLAGWYTFGQ